MQLLKYINVYGSKIGDREWSFLQVFFFVFSVAEGVTKLLEKNLKQKWKNSFRLVLISDYIQIFGNVLRDQTPGHFP